MPVQTSYPGVYIEEIPSGVPTITGVATSITAFIGYTDQGPVDEAVEIFSFSDFQRNYGTMTVDSPLSYAVNQFFQNGGNQAYVVRVASGATSAQLSFEPSDTSLNGQGIQVTAASDGTWGNLIQLEVDYDTSNPDSFFEMTVTEYAIQNNTPVVQATESYTNLSMSSMSPNYFLNKINGVSQLIQVAWTPPATFAYGYSQGGFLDGATYPLNVSPWTLTSNQNRIAISIDGGAALEISLFTPGTSLAGTSLADLLGKVQSGMQAAITAAFGPGKATVIPSANNNYLIVTSGGKTQASAIRITNASQNDAAGILKLGLANGGFEKEGAAGYRPVQNGTISGMLSSNLTGTVTLPATSLVVTFGTLTLTAGNASTGVLQASTYYVLLTGLDSNQNEQVIASEQSVPVVATGSISCAYTVPAGYTAYRLYVGTASGKYNLGYQTAGISPVNVTGQGLTTGATPPPSSGSIAINVFQPGATTQSNASPIILQLWTGSAPTTMNGIVNAINAALAKLSGSAKQYLAGSWAESQVLLAGVPATPGNYLRIVPGSANTYFKFQNYIDTTADSLLLTQGKLSSTSYGFYQVGSGFDSTNTVTAVTSAGTIAGNNGTAPSSVADYGDPVAKTGMYSLDNVDLFNIMCLPDVEDNSSLSALYPSVIEYCALRRAMLIVDLPASITTIAAAQNWMSNGEGASLNFNNVAAYFPRMMAADPLQNSNIHQFPNCGAMAGIWANTDANRGVWKAPAGTQANINGATGLVYRMNDSENGVLNPIGLNCLRTFPVIGTVVWGARTMRGADALEDDYKYIPVRRLAYYLEESLYRGTQWVVFEPNAEPLWAAIRLSVGSFMHSMYRQGAFAGTTPAQAYFVKCSSETTTPYDQDQGRVNIIVGFAPLYPAEFVILQIQQIVNVGPI